jgi:hypothetical protein
MYTGDFDMFRTIMVDSFVVPFNLDILDGHIYYINKNTSSARPPLPSIPQDHYCIQNPHTHMRR